MSEKRYDFEVYDPSRDSPAVTFENVPPGQVAAALKAFVDRNDYRMVVTRKHRTNRKGVDIR